MFYECFRYPLEEFVRENDAEDKRCLTLVEESIEFCKKEGHPVVGVIVEPIQSEGGDFHGSNAWFQVNFSEFDLQPCDWFSYFIYWDICYFSY